MTTPEDVAALARQYGDEREAATRSELESQIDQLAAQRDAARAELADVKVALAECQSGEPEPSGSVSELVGVRIFPHYSGKTYGNHDALFSWLSDSGLRRVTGLVSTNTPADTIAFYKRLNVELGIKMWLTIGQPRQVFSSGDWTNVANKIDAMGGADAVEQVANWNEPNHMRNTGDIPLTDWPKKAGQQQQGLWNMAHPQGIDVATPQLWSGRFSQHEADLRTMAPFIEGYFDYIAWHLYPRGGVGEDLVQSFYDLYYGVLGEHPVCVTEAGYFNAANYTGGAVAVTPEQAGQYIVPHIRLYTDRGDRFGGFEFLNDPDPSQANREAGLGWIWTPSLDPKTWSAKPIYHSVKAFINA